MTAPPRTASLHEVPEGSSPAELLESTIGLARLGRPGDALTVEQVANPALAGAEGHTIFVAGDWVDAIWRWGLALVEGRMTVAVLAATPEGRPSRVRTIARRDDGWDVRDQQLHIGAADRWRLAVF